MPSQHGDVVGAGPSAEPTAGRRSAAGMVAALVVGAVLGSGVTALLLDEGPGPVRVHTAVGVPQQSLGELVLPVDVVNAGRTRLRVQEVRPADGASVTFALVTDDVVVPAGGARELLVRVGRDCPSVERLTAQDVRFAVVVRVDDTVVTEPVPLSGGAAAALGIALRCEP